MSIFSHPCLLREEYEVYWNPCVLTWMNNIMNDRKCFFVISNLNFVLISCFTFYTLSNDLLNKLTLKTTNIVIFSTVSCFYPLLVYDCVLVWYFVIQGIYYLSQGDLRNRIPFIILSPVEGSKTRF